MMKNIKTDFDKNEFWENIIYDIADSGSKGTIESHIERYCKLYGESIEGFYDVLVHKAREISRPERDIYYNKENISDTQIQEIESMSFLQGFEDDKKLKDWFLGYYVTSQLSGLINLRRQNPKSFKLTWVWLSLLGMEDPTPKGTFLNTQERLLIFYMLQEHDYMKSHGLNKEELLLENNSKNIFFLSQLLDIPEKTFGNPLSVIGPTFLKLDENPSLEWLRNKIRILENLIIVFEKSIYTDIAADLRIVHEEFLSKKKQIEQQKKK